MTVDNPKVTEEKVEPDTKPSESPTTGRPSLFRRAGRRPIKPTSWGVRFDFLEYFPVQPTYAIQQTLAHGLTTLLAWFAALNKLEIPKMGLDNRMIFWLAGSLTFSYIYSLIYREAFRRRMTYFMEDYRIFSGRGVFCRTINSGQFTPMWDFTIGQTPMDWLFDVWHLRLYADFAQKNVTHTVPSLTREDAFAFLAFMQREADRQIDIADGAATRIKEMELRALEAEEAALETEV